MAPKTAVAIDEPLTALQFSHFSATSAVVFVVLRPYMSIEEQSMPLQNLMV